MPDVDTFVVGAPLPRIRTVSAHDGLRVTLTWESDGPDARTQTIDLAPAVYRYKIYAPLRENQDLFRTVHVADDGFAVAWNDDDLDMASTTIAELAEQAMTPADFADFMKRNAYTLDSVAAELGISRRLAAYYAKEREIPRTVALACRYLDSGRQGSGMGATQALSRRHQHIAAKVGQGGNLSEATVEALNALFGLMDQPMAGGPTEDVIEAVERALDVGKPVTAGRGVSSGTVMSSGTSIEGRKA